MVGTYSYSHLHDNPGLWVYLLYWLSLDLSHDAHMFRNNHMGAYEEIENRIFEISTARKQPFFFGHPQKLAEVSQRKNKSYRVMLS